MSKITVDNLSTPAAAATETLLKTVAPDGYLNLPRGRDVGYPAAEAHVGPRR